ncbi:hypothetical protein [Domibacillus mangrovi]|nr:hypothetical protein [Domibacillus mangrovi]
MKKYNSMRKKVNEMIYNYIQEGIVIPDANGIILLLNPALPLTI